MAARTTPEQIQQMPTSLMEALKEELFQIEADRLQGTLAAEEYASAKQTLIGTIKLALARGHRSEGTIE